MARCSCAGGSCSCTVLAGAGLTITGTGKTSDPFRIALASSNESAVADAGGTLDLTGIDDGGTVSTLLASDVSSVTMPAIDHGQFEVFVKQDVGGNTVMWPADVQWPAGAAPTLTPTAGRGDLLSFRRIGTSWVGMRIGEDIG
jgi:hypothetical protein